MKQGDKVRIIKIAKVRDNNNDLELGEYLEGKLATSIIPSTPIVISNFKTSDVISIVDNTIVTKDGMYKIEIYK